MAKREPELSFEERMARLEQLVSQLEAGKLPLSESFGAYEQGIALLGQLEKELAAHEAKIQVLTQKGEEMPLDVEEGDADE